MAPRKTNKKSTFSTPSTYSTAGRLIRDPEVETFEYGGKSITRMKLVLLDATKSERHVDFFPEIYVDDPKRIAWLSRMRKDDPIRVEGKLELRLFERKDGTPGVSAEIRWPRVVERGEPPAPISVAETVSDEAVNPYETPA
jgi:single-stranded DNA-binding protein